MDYQRHYYSFYDRVAQEFMPVFPAKNDADAIRCFKDALAKGQYQHYEDYELYFIETLTIKNKEVLLENAEVVKIGYLVYNEETKKFDFLQENRGLNNE